MLLGYYTVATEFKKPSRMRIAGEPDTSQASGWNYAWKTQKYRKNVPGEKLGWDFIKAAIEKLKKARLGVTWLGRGRGRWSCKGSLKQGGLLDCLEAEGSVFHGEILPQYTMLKATEKDTWHQLVASVCMFSCVSVPPHVYHTGMNMDTYIHSALIHKSYYPLLL